MNTLLLKTAYIIVFPIVILLQIAVGLKLNRMRAEADVFGAPILSLENSVWGIVGYLAYGLSPAFTCPDGEGNPVIVSLRRVCLGVILHEGGHCHYPPAQPTSMAEVKKAHKNKGARFEHQADKWSVIKMRELGCPKEEFDKYIEFLAQAPGDGPYRARMLRRFIRRYHIV